jgi:CheY-like chemotaxis protein
MAVNDGGGSELWAQDTVRCVLVPNGLAVDVELRNAEGNAFLRKTAPTHQAARNEAEFLRLLLRRDHRQPGGATLKPFALVIEADQDNRDALIESLKICGFRALGCGRGTEGIDLARQLAPDLVLIDYKLPDVTGSEVCRELRADPETSRVPIIAVTAIPEALRVDGAQVDAVLTKPCQLDTLIAAARLFVRHLPQVADSAL